MLVSVVEIARRTSWRMLVDEVQSIKLIVGSSYNSENDTLAIISLLFALIVSKMNAKFGLLFSSYEYKLVSMSVDEDDDDDNNKNIDNSNEDDLSIRSSIKSSCITITDELTFSCNIRLSFLWN